MILLRISQRARLDLREIARFTIQRWGKTQSTSYVTEIRECCQQLTATPTLGRPYRRFTPSLRKFDHGSHVILYQQNESEFLVVRILHKSMLPALHSMDDSDSM